MEHAHPGVLEYTLHSGTAMHSEACTILLVLESEWISTKGSVSTSITSPDATLNQESLTQVPSRLRAAAATDHKFTLAALAATCKNGSCAGD